MSGRTRTAGAYRRPRGDEGFTVTELLVAMGIFSLLMVVVGAATLSLFSAIRAATTRSDVQTESQNAMEWISRLIRYAQAPDATHSVVELATGTSLRVYSYAGLSPVTDMPVKVQISTENQPDGARRVISQVWDPVRSGSSWVWSATPQRRTLLTIPADVAGNPLTFQYYACTPTADAGCGGTVVPITPSVAGVLPLGALQVLESVTVSLGDPSLPDSRVTQSVKLVNQA